ncbi:MAG TPA: MnmC family methyltransferase [Polyangiaceae bacterium]|nr:MnmC family methyltransferase [Polyangiaceae bacterium]
MPASDDDPRPVRDGDFELVTLRNGTRAVRHSGHGEVMHPSVGPWQEACALYVEQSRLAEKLQVEGPPLCVWDVGLGAGTNAVAALTRARELGARQRRALRIVSFEIDLSPLRLALADAQGFAFLQPFAQAGAALLRGESWSHAQSHWQLRLGDAPELWRSESEPADLIFFDPFSPASNPTLWTPAAFAGLRAHARSDGDGCTLFTYSAATPTRVSLLLGGFFVGTGIATGMKKETTVAATRRELLTQPLDARWLARWERSAAQAPHGVALTDSVRSALQEHAQWRA